MPPKKKKSRYVANLSGTRDLLEEPLSGHSQHLLPKKIAVIAFFASFALPNLVFSGPFFYDTLHIMKWATTLVPLALLGMIAGFKVLRRGTAATGFRLDSFGAVWLVLLLYVTLQSLWAPPRSWVTFYQEWFFFASLWLVYVLATLTADRKLLRLLIWGALLNAALNVLFAELQMRGLSSPFPFILPAPRNYIGNTGQQNMLGLWLALTGLGGSFLLLSSEPLRKRPLLNTVLFLLLSAVFHGLIATTSRSGILSLASGFFVLSLFFLRIDGKRHLSKIGCLLLLFIVLTGATMTTTPSRSAALTAKLEDVVERPLSIAYRDSIWATSWVMFENRPLQGVGLGQYKWHYMDAAKEMAERWPHLEVRYTHWAHNEFLQWMAEAGAPGAALMFFLWFWWGWSLLRAFIKKTPLSPEAVWGSALVALFFFNALWTRPFHRIENAVWLALAFAATNRELLRPLFSVPAPERFEKRGRVLAGAICILSLFGLLYFGDGVRGDRTLRIAVEKSHGGGSAITIAELYSKAYNSLMVRDLAEKEAGYFSVRLGEATGNPDLIAEGLNQLIRHFDKQPHVDELNFLLRWAHRMSSAEFLEYIRSFVPPQTPAKNPPVPAEIASPERIGIPSPDLEDDSK